MSGFNPTQWPNQTAPWLAPEEIQSMTHQPEQPNPAQSVLDWLRQFYETHLQADYSPVHLPGTEPKDYLRELAQNPDILAKNIDQASNFAGMAGTLKIKAPAIRAGKDVFEGVNHGDALDNLRNIYPYDKYKQAVNNIEEGFTTSAGNFVNREEALNIARKTGQYQNAGYNYPDTLVTENLKPSGLTGGRPVGMGMSGLRNRLQEKWATNRSQREEMDKWLEQIGAKKSTGLPPIPPDYKWTLSGRLVKSSPEADLQLQESQAAPLSWLDILRGQSR